MRSDVRTTYLRPTLCSGQGNSPSLANLYAVFRPSISMSAAVLSPTSAGRPNTVEKGTDSSRWRVMSLPRLEQGGLRRLWTVAIDTLLPLPKPAGSPYPAHVVHKAQAVSQGSQPLSLHLLGKGSGHRRNGDDPIGRAGHVRASGSFQGSSPFTDRIFLRATTTGQPPGGERRVHQLSFSVRGGICRDRSSAFQYSLHQSGAHVGALGPRPAGDRTGRSTEPGRQEPQSDERPTPFVPAFRLLTKMVCDMTPGDEPIRVVRLPPTGQVPEVGQRDGLSPGARCDARIGGLAQLLPIGVLLLDEPADVREDIGSVHRAHH